MRTLDYGYYNYQKATKMGTANVWGMFCIIIIFYLINILVFIFQQNQNQKPIHLRIYPFSPVSKWVSGTVCRGESPVCALKAGLYGESACL